MPHEWDLETLTEPDTEPLYEVGDRVAFVGSNGAGEIVKVVAGTTGDGCFPPRVARAWAYKVHLDNDEIRGYLVPEDGIIPVP